MTPLIIRPANFADTEGVIALRMESESWLRDIGIEQWHDTDRGIRNIQDGIRDGATSVITENDEAIVATVTLNGPDPDWWKPSDSPEDALYLYKLIVHSTWRGTGLGDEIMDWACDQAQKREKRWLRLDCWRTNYALHNYYLSRGFQHIRTDFAEGRGSGALFERDVAVRTATTTYLQ